LSCTCCAPAPSWAFSVDASACTALTSAAAGLLAPGANGIMLCLRRPAAAAGEGVTLAGAGAAFAVRRGLGALGTSVTVKVVGPVSAAGAGAGAARRGLGAGAVSANGPTSRAALSSGTAPISAAGEAIGAGFGGSALRATRLGGGGAMSGALANWSGDVTGAVATAAGADFFFGTCRAKSLCLTGM